jgi:outer membrane protein assembly factor BamD
MRLLWRASGVLFLAFGPGAGAVRAGEGDLEAWVGEGRWPRGGATAAPTPALQMEKAKRLEALGDVRQAAEQYRRVAEVYMESQEAEEALILSARCYLAAGSYTKCRDQLNELRRRYVHPTYLDAMGQVEAALGRGYLEGKGEGGTFRLSSRLRKARAIFQHILDEDPQGRWADDALLGLGQCEEAVGRWDPAMEQYTKLLEKYPASELRAEAEGRIAYCLAKREPHPEYSEAETKEALRRIGNAREEAAGGDTDLDAVALEENERMLRARLAEKRYDQAQFYAKNGHYRAAEVYYELIRTRYPETPWAKKAEEALNLMRRR